MLAGNDKTVHFLKYSLMQEVDTMTPYRKIGKRAQKEMNAQKRVSWGFSPVSRIKPNAKVYNRKHLDRY